MNIRPVRPGAGPTKRRASSIGVDGPKKKAKRGKTKHIWTREEQDYVLRLLASDWSDEEVCDFYFLREDASVCC